MLSARKCGECMKGYRAQSRRLERKGIKEGVFKPVEGQKALSFSSPLKSLFSHLQTEGCFLPLARVNPCPFGWQFVAF